MSLTVDQKHQLLSKIEETVNKRFYDPSLDGQKWSELLAQHKDQIVHSPSTEAFEAAVTSLLSELRSSGTGLLAPQIKVSSRNSISASFRRIPDTPEGDRWAFQDVQPGGVAERAGVQSADVLVSIGAKPALPTKQPEFEMGRSVPIEISRNGARKQIQILTARPIIPEQPLLGAAERGCEDDRWRYWLSQGVAVSRNDRN